MQPLASEQTMTTYEDQNQHHITRLIGDMRIRNLARQTSKAYGRQVKRFADFIKKPLDRATPEENTEPS